MSRVYNFSAGPAVLPEEVLQEAADEMLDYRGCGMSVMEMSHRSGTYQKIIDEAEADLRQLMGIPDNYKVLFLQGGRKPAVCDDSDEPDEKPRSGLHHNRTVGRKRRGKRLPFTERQMRLHPPRIRPFPIFRTAPICRSTRTRIMYIFVKITPFTEPNSKRFRIQRENPLLRMFPPASYPSRLM